MPKSVLILALVLTGCAPVAEVAQPRFLFGTRADPQQAIELSKLPYPVAAPVAGAVDIIAIKRGSTLTLVNRTTRVYKNVQLWLNQQYVAVIDEIAIGANDPLTLDSFINSYGEAFPVGGLLNPDKSFPIVLAEIYVERGDERGDANGDASEDEQRAGVRYKVIVRSEDPPAPGQ